MVACPFCGSEMEEGAIGIYGRGGERLLWCGVPERKRYYWQARNSEVLMPIKQPVLVLYMPMCLAFRCADCETVVLKYAESCNPPSHEDASTEEDKTVDDDIQIERESPVEETEVGPDQAKDEEILIREYQPAEDEDVRIVEEQATDEEGSIEEERPVDEEKPVEEDQASNEEAPVEKDTNDVQTKPKKFKFQ